MPRIQKLWRVFPWDADAGEGEPFSPSYINPSQDDGRYDLQGNPLILNLAESPAHAIAEQIQARHGRRLSKKDLTESGSGDWHCTVLFMDRATDLLLGFGRPRLLTLRSRGLRQAAGVLDISLR